MSDQPSITPDVQDFLNKANQLTVEAVRLSGHPDEAAKPENQMMLRMVNTSIVSLQSALMQIRMG